MTPDRALYHGGIPGLRVGDIIAPGHERMVLDDCPICRARAAGIDSGIDGPTLRPDRVYATTHRLYAKHYASLYGRGDLYRVVPVGECDASTEDTIPTFAAESLRVEAVYERAVLLTMTERRRLFREWGEFDAAHAARYGAVS